MIVVPAIDLRGGRVVRLRQGDYAAETVYDGEPAAVARGYGADGAAWLHVVDLDAARDGRFANLDALAAIVQAAPMPVQAGGGVRSAADVVRLLGLGVARVVVGSVAVREPATVIDWIARFGADRICVALDVRADADAVFRPAVKGWTEGGSATLWELLVTYGDVAPGLAVLCTDISRDGMMSGPNLALYRRMRAAQPDLALLASGGIRDERDLAALRALGLHGAIVGRALLERPGTLREMLAC